MDSRKYCLIVGHGRSGTNWLLDLFQFSGASFCRNEPHAVPGSPFQALVPDQNVILKDKSRLRASWDAAIDHTGRTLGPRDPQIVGAKDFFHAFGNLVGRHLLGRRKLLKALSTFQPSLRGEEWALPSWVARGDAYTEAPCVIKLLQAPGFAAFVLAERPEVPVFHIVRHPGGFLNSWSNRYLAHRDADEVLRQNRERLDLVRESSSAWAELIPPPDTLDAEESELWYWRYATESCHLIGLEKRSYKAVVFEELAARPLEVMRDLYADACLSWNDEIGARIVEACRRSNSLASGWRSRLNDEQVAKVEKVLADAPIQGLWTGTER